SSASFAQQAQTSSVPQAIKYQAIARNTNGEAIANQTVSFRVSILEGSTEGTTVYQETQTAKTNQFGLANMEIGNGTATNGKFNAIQWGNNTYYAKIEFDPKGGSDYAYMGTSQLLSVPYSLYAEHAKIADNLPSFPIKASLKGTNLQAPFDSPETGMLVYNTDSAGSVPYDVIPGYYYNAGTPTDPKWVLLSDASNYSWAPSKNRPMTTSCANTSNITTYGGVVQDGAVGAAVGAPTGANNTGFGYLVFSGGSCGGTATTGADNTGVGNEALNSLSSGVDNTAVGSLASYSNTSGSYNTANGYQALYNNFYAGYNIADGYKSLYTISYGSSSWSSYNTAIGDWTLYYDQPTSTSNGVQNTAVGYSSISGNSTGIDNTAIGYYALKEASYATGNYNTAGGAYAAASNSTGSQNSAFGDSALYTNATGNYNTSTGYASLLKSTTSYNTADGFEALYNNTTGDSNTAVGYKALNINITGSGNTAVGFGADVNANNYKDAAAIGANATVHLTNTMEFGDVNVLGWGFGNAIPTTGGTGSKVLIVGTTTTNGNGAYLTGNGMWTSISDRHKKENFIVIDKDSLLNKIISLPITRWNYKGDPASLQYIGPVAQDFYKTFQVGGDSLAISCIEPGNIALAGVQALNQKLERENSELKLQLEQLQKIEIIQAQLGTQQSISIADAKQQIVELRKLIESITQAQASAK
ncbi:MAG TPA: tail fiber domain-containing protein, partial [Bacteroidia bacterium]|nr:tail fiber domain-containing protein [Bacteroidia bacterium]